MKLLQSIFGAGETRGRYPEALIDQAIDRAIAGTDARLRLLPGCRRRLRGPVVSAIDHVVALVDGIQAPVPATKAGYARDPRLSALFASPAAMLDTLSRDRALGAFLATGAGRAATRITALLLAERSERTVLGVALAGEHVQRDVRQVTVSFGGHLLLEPTADETENRRQLKRRAFDHLLTRALEAIVSRRVERADLKRQRDLLRRKLQELTRGGWRFDATDEEVNADAASIEADLDRTDAQLQALGSDQDVLKAHLGIVEETLDVAPRELWFEPLQLVLDAMNIRCDAMDPSARTIELNELHTGRQRRLVILPLTIDPGELPAREDLVTAAQRYLY
jgi:hypothetical protein